MNRISTDLDRSNGIKPHQDAVATVPSRSRSLIAVWAATALYLIVELSFNARLLDVVGGSASSSEIDAIEVWGRLISGFALALLGWPWAIKYAWAKFRNWIARLLFLFAWTLLAMAVMYAGQEALIRKLVERSDHGELTQAQHLMLLRQGLDRGVVELPGLEVSRERLSSADGKAFLATFPMIGSGLGALIAQQFGPEQRSEVTRKLALNGMGDPNEHLTRYTDMVGSLEEGYETYGQALQDIDAEGEKAWRRYVRKLRSNGMKPHNVRRGRYERVRRGVRDMGVYVADDWRPNDKTGFLEAATKDGRRSASQTFVSELSSKSPEFAGIDPPDTLVAFVHEPATQGPLLAALGYQCIRTFDADMETAEKFKERIYDADIECLVARNAAEEGQLEKGQEAMRALLVPMIALALSLLGALTHIGKLAVQTNRLVRGREPKNASKLYAAVLFAPLCAVLLFAWIPLSEITESNLYRSLERRLSYPLAMVVRGTIHGQHLGYPIFEATRVHLLQGFNFGYVGDDEPVAAAAAAADVPNGTE